MSMRSLIPLALAVSLAAGCQLGPRMNAHLELMNAEKRALEDELYTLEFDYEDAIRELEGLRKENERLKQRVGPSYGSGGSRTFGGESTGHGKKSEAPPSGPELRPPVIEEGTLTEPKVELPEDRRSKPGDLPAPKPPTPSSPPSPKTQSPKNQSPKTSQTTDRQNPAKSTAWSLEPADPRVTHIHLNPLLTGGSDFDQQPGDDGITVVIEPRNTEDVFVPLAGPVSVVLIDPAQEGEPFRVARWDLDASQTERMLDNSPASRGIRLRLPWPKAAPSSARLHLFVRYITLDGRKLESNREIFLTLPGQISQRWTPRSTTRSAAEKEIATTSSDNSSGDRPSNEFSSRVASDTPLPIPAISDRLEKPAAPGELSQIPSAADTPISTGSEPPKSVSSSSPPTPEWRPYR